MDLYLQSDKAYQGIEIVDGDTNKVVASSPDSWAALEYIARAENYSDMPFLKRMFNNHQ
jgi:hypothetical protein